VDAYQSDQKKRNGKNGDTKGYNIQYLCEVLAVPPLQAASSGREWRIMAPRYKGQLKIH
jgi:hypothetical protein